MDVKITGGLKTNIIKIAKYIKTIEERDVAKESKGLIMFTVDDMIRATIKVSGPDELRQAFAFVEAMSGVVIVKIRSSFTGAAIR